jgi:hypothetical protein
MGKEDGIHAVEEDNIAPPPHYREGGAPQVITSELRGRGRGERGFSSCSQVASLRWA